MNIPQRNCPRRKLPRLAMGQLGAPLGFDTVPDHGSRIGTAEVLDRADAGWGCHIDLGEVTVDHIDADKEKPAFAQRRPDSRANLALARREVGFLRRAAPCHIRAKIVWRRPGLEHQHPGHGRNAPRRQHRRRHDRLHRLGEPPHLFLAHRPHRLAAPGSNQFRFGRSEHQLARCPHLHRHQPNHLPPRPHRRQRLLPPALSLTRQME